MKRFVESRSPCPIGRASRVLGDRWVLLILRECFLGAERFEQFVARLPISRAALSSRLAIMVEAGLLQRDPPTGKRAVYTLTESGRALAPVMESINRWSAENLFSPDENQVDWSRGAYQS